MRHRQENKIYIYLYFAFKEIEASLNLSVILHMRDDFVFQLHVEIY